MIKTIPIATVAATLTLLTLSGCCLRKVDLKPELGALDLIAAKAGTATFGVTFEFKECCPGKEQKQLALDLQTKTALLFDKLVSGEIDLARYNALVSAANASLTNVILVCNALKKTEATGLATPVTLSRITLRDPLQPKVLSASPRNPNAQDLAAAWTQVEEVLSIMP